MQRRGDLSAFSLFSGAGGLDLGVERAGFKVVYAVERDETAVATLNRNRQRFFKQLPEVTPSDIKTLEPRKIMRQLGVAKGDIDILVGGPPCVAFSKSGFHLEYKRQGKDERANLLRDYLKFLDALRPQAFLMENVFGLAYQNQSAKALSGFRAGVAELGYSLTVEVLNAADYGVPQNRQRLFLVGARDGKTIEFPPPTHWGEHERRVRPPEARFLKPHVTAGDAIGSLETEPEPSDAVNGLYGHLLSDIPPGGNYLHYTKEKGHQNPLFKWRSRYWTFLLKLDPDRPATTIQGQPGPYVGPFHWDNRRLRIPELKALQGFPRTFKIEGSRRDVQLQIGNSVPPLLGQIVADAIARQLSGQTLPSALRAQLQLSLQMATR